MYKLSYVNAGIALLFLVFFVQAHALPTRPSLASLRPDLSAFAHSLLQCRRLPGLSVAVVRVSKAEGNEQLTFADGLADASTGRTANVTTRFCLAGVTQPFTAAALLNSLRRNTSLNLESPIHPLLNGFHLSNSSIGLNLSSADILSHRAGLAPYFGGLLLGYNMTRLEIIRRLRFVPSVGTFRHSAIPAPLLYVLAGHLINTLEGMTWEQVVDRHFFKPLNMRQSTFADRVSRWNDDFALPHALRQGQLIPLSSKVTGNVLRPVGPALSVCSSAEDMTSWLTMLLRNGSSRADVPVLHPDDVSDMFTDHNAYLATPTRQKKIHGKLPVDARTNAYTLGWISGSYRGYRRYFVNGFANSYGAFLSILPDLGIGIFTAANGPSLAAMDNAFRVLHYYLSDLVLGEKPWLNSTGACSFPRPWLKPVNEGNIPSTPSPTSTPMATQTDSLPDNQTTIQPDSPTDSLTSQPDSPTDSLTSQSTSPTDSLTSQSDSPTDSLMDTPTDSSTEEVTVPSIETFGSRLVTISSTASTTISDKMDRSPSSKDFSTSSSSATSWPLTTVPHDTSISDSETASPYPSDLSYTVLDALVRAGANALTQDDTAMTLADLGVSPTVEMPVSNHTLKKRVRRKVLNPFPMHIGTYTHPFFGDLYISFNRTAGSLQLDYGFYGKAHLVAHRPPSLFVLRFFSALWYVSDSDDSIRFPLGQFLVRFKRNDTSSKMGPSASVTVPFFEPASPPVFYRQS